MPPWAEAAAVVALLQLAASLGPAIAVVVDAEEELGGFPRALLGVSGEPSTAGATRALASVGLPHARVHVYFERAFPAPGVERWDEVDRRFGAARAIGAEPVAVLAYSPAWLSACGAAEPRFCPPADLDAWSALVERAATYVATAHGVRAFEAWNEPNNPGFFAGTLPQYLALYEATARGVADAAAATGLDLALGGPATVSADPVWIPAWLAHAQARELPVDFVSFHWYADYPFFGPVGPLPGTLAREHPAPPVAAYAAQASLARAWADAAGFPDAGVWIDEWNLNAGDSPRARSRYAAPFVVAAVATMADARVDRASFFTVEHPAWGLLAPGGEARPAWRALAALLALDGERVAARAGDPSLVALAARAEDGSLSVLLARFDPTGPPRREVALAAPGFAGARFAAATLEGVPLAEGALPRELVLSMGRLDVVAIEIGPSPARGRA